MTSWRIFAASATGKSHADRGVPCQDAFAHALVGDVLIAVVCDGAGSARYSQAGAEFIARSVVHALSTRVGQGEELPELSGDQFEQAVASVIGLARNALQEVARAAGAGMADYASTLVGVVATPERGSFFHIGDGVGVAQPCDTTAVPDISLPANGEYANETYFVTGPHWRERLKVLPIRQPLRGVVLMSDGAMPFAMSKGNAGLYPPFMTPVERYLLGVAGEDEGNRALAATLDDPRTHHITGDDKTLLIALRA